MKIGEKYSFQNRKDQKIAVLINHQEVDTKWAVLCHGLGGTKDQPLLESMARVLYDKGYSIVRYDGSNGVGESEGSANDATFGNAIEDMEDIMTWLKTQEWFALPCIIGGHSMGGICAIMYAENHPEDISGLMPFASVITGELSFESHLKAYPQEMKEWMEKGVRHLVGVKNVEYFLPWSHVENRKKYDGLKKIKNVVMPLLMVVGELDKHCPVEHQKIFFDAVPHEKKDFVILKNTRHTYRDDEQMRIQEDSIKNWISRYFEE